MSGFGMWRTVSALLQIEDKFQVFFPNKLGRMIYEEFDPAVGESSQTSKFFEVKSGMVKNLDQGVEVLVNLADKESCEELTES